MKKIFLKYPSLRNVSSVKFSKLDKNDFEREFVATEKLHGTNTGIYVFKDGSMDLGSRTQFVGFDNVNSTHKKLSESIDKDYFKEIGLQLIEKHGFEYIIFYGEFFGANIFSNMGYKQVKDNINEFKVFNIIGVLGEVINLDEPALDAIKLSFDEVQEVLSSEYLVPFERKGKLVELIKSLDLNTDSNYGGKREGYVIQPTEEIRFFNNTGFALKGIKIKSEKFTEVKPKKIKTEVATIDKMIRGLNEDMVRLVKDMERYVTESRLQNVISHGDLEVTSENIMPITKEFLKDILDEYQNVYNHDEKELGVANKRLTNPAIVLVKNYINTIAQKELDSL